MIKRFIACLTICLIIAGIFSPVYSHAEPVPIYTPNWSDPGIAEIIDISDLTGWMANGGVFDITDFQDLEEFMGWYFKLRVPVQEEDGNYSFAPYYGNEKSLDYGSPSQSRFIEQSNIRGMIGRTYQNKVGYGRRLQDQVDKALLEDGNLSNVLIPLLDFSEAGYFVEFDTNALSRYKRSFDDSEPVVIPDEYLSYLSLFNDLTPYGFTFANMPTGWSNQWGDRFTIRSNPATSYSYFTTNRSGGSNFTAFSYTNGLSVSNVQAANAILTLYITGSGDNYSGYIDNITDLNIAYKGNSNYQYISLSVASDYTCSMLSASAYGNISNHTNGATCSYSGTLSDVLNYFSQRFKNINVSVNGQLWATAGEPEEVLTPEFPDVVGGDELPVTTWPLKVPRAPYYIDLPGLNSAFQRAKTTDNNFDFDDLIDNLKDTNGDPVVDPDIEEVPVPIPNPDPINPEIVPELPDLPLIPPANNPGFSGVSVLAEIINFTNQSLPSALITVFWGIVFGAVILGIIKILHK